MKILIIGPFPDPVNGCSFANFVLFRNLKCDNKVEIIDTSLKNISGKHGGSFNLSKVVPILLSYLKFYRIIFSDVVYLTPGQTFFGVLKYFPFFFTCLLIKKPYVIHLHGNYLGAEYISLSNFKKKIFNFLIGNAKAGIALSNSLRKNFRDMLPDQKVKVVENFVDDFFFEKKLIQKDCSSLKIVFLSNLMEEKGIFIFLKALSVLKDKGIEFTAKIAGNFESETELLVRNELQKLKDNVEYLGVVKGKEKFELLENSNIFVLPTFYKMEGQPISILEAMAAGNIIITTNHAGIPDIVDTKNGFLITPKSTDDLVQKFLEVNNDICYFVNNFSTINHNYVRENFTEEKFVLKITKILNDVVYGS